MSTIRRTGKVNRYTVEPVDNDPPLSDGRVRTWIVWDRPRARAVEDVDTREQARTALKKHPQERIDAETAER